MLGRMHSPKVEAALLLIVLGLGVADVVKRWLVVG